MKKTGMMLTFFLILATMLLQAPLAGAATDGVYQLTEVSQPVWDGTTASRTIAPTADYDYTYGDEASVTYTLPWAFTFYGQSYSSITADTNGNVWFSATDSAHSFDLATTGRGSVIAAWNANLSSYYYGGVFIQHKSNPERVVIEWQSETYGDEGYNRQNNFEVVLYPNGSIRTDYRTFGAAMATDAGSGISKGDGSASLGITVNYGNAYTLAGRSFLFGGGQRIYLTSLSDSFGDVFTGTTSQPRTVTVYNSGTDTLQITAASLTANSSGMFAVAAGGDGCSGATLLPSQSCAVQVVFSPTSVGLQSALLSISSSDPETPSLDVALSGNGQNPTLTVARSDSGSGSVTSTPAGIDCGTACAAQFATGSSVTLTAMPGAGSVFTGWSGACSGTGDCTVTMDEAKSVAAAFTSTSQPTVTIASPSGLTASNRPLLQYSVSSGTSVVKVDGIVVNKVSGDLLDTLSEGTHLVRVEATNAAGYSGFAESSVIVDTQAPAMVMASPAAGAQSIPVKTTISFTFDEALSSDSVSQNSIVLSSAFGNVPGRVKLSADATTVTFTPLVELGYNRDYTVTFTAQVADLIGNPTAVNYTSTFKTQVASSDLVGLWHMDGDWSDASGNGRNGTANGGATFNSNRADGTMAGSFDGVDDYVSILDADGLSPQLQGQLTLSAWVYLKSYPTATQIRVPILAKGSGSNYEYALYVYSTGRAGLSLWQLSGAGHTEISGGTIPLNKWTHVSGVYSLAGTKKSVVYIDGVETANSTTTLGSVGNGTSPVHFAHRPDLGQNNNLNALIDTVALYKRALTPEEVLVLANSVPKIAITSPGQTVMYKPGESGVATVTVTHPVGVTSLSCIASGAATDSLTLFFDSPQTQITQDFAFQIAPNQVPNASVSILCNSEADASNVGSATLKLQVVDTQVPVVVGSSVQDHATNVSATIPITITYTEALDPATVNGASVTLIKDDGTNLPVAGEVTLSADQKIITFTQEAALEVNTQYRLTVSTEVTDMVGNPLPQDSVLHFTTSPIAELSIIGKGSSSYPYIVAANRYSSISLDNSYVVFDGPVTADNISLANGSVLSHYGSTTTAVYKLEVTATSVNVDATSWIDVTGKGYMGGTTNNSGRTLNNAVGSSPNNGGSYAGLGGVSVWGGSVNASYGSLQLPNELGSGGGGGGVTGSNGGGLIKLSASELILNGYMLADGGTVTTAGAGSGGGIYLNVGVLSGSGLIRAKGGSTTDTNCTTGCYGAGGGGRIAIYYNTNTLPVANITAPGGKSGTGGNGNRNGGAGTVYLKDNAKAKGDVIISNGGTGTLNTTTVPGGDYGQFEVKGNAKVSVSGNLTTETDLPITSSNVTFGGELTVPGNFTSDSSNITATGAMNIAGALTLKNNSILGHQVATTTTTYKLDITATSVNVDATSWIIVTGKGYLGGATNNSGRTLNNAVGSSISNGGSYAALGGISTWGGSVNGSYGSMQQPNELGSGGGGGSISGGNGGGLVKLTASELTLNGYILADGDTVATAGGGSGGGILLNIGSLSGSGLIRAKGGSTTDTNCTTGCYGAGGGGRIAIYYNTNTLPVANITAPGGKSGTGGNGNRNGGAGTVYLKDNAKPKADVIINNGGIATSNTTTVPGGDYDLFEVKGGAVLAVTGTMTPGTDMVITGSQLSLNGGLTVPGSLTLDGSSVTVAGAIAVGSSLTLKNGSVLSHYGSTTTAVYKLEVTAGSIDIDATSRIDVTGKGYLGGRQGGNATDIGMTLGNTTTGGSTYYANGGSYGGLGGRSNSGSVNVIYGSLQQPNEVGSGGSAYGSGTYGGNGGGHVRLVTGSLVLNGSILADGSGITNNGGGGSGGGVWINVGTLSGSGMIAARGGSYTPNTNYGSGGGGRIAIYYDANTLPVSNLIATGGKSGDGSNATRNGSAGTIFLFQNNFVLSVAVEGAGAGAVNSALAGISCGTTCSSQFANGSSVTLTPAPATGSQFTGWSGACTGSGSCIVTMDAGKSVTATFDLITYSISGTVTDVLGGTISPSSASVLYGGNTTFTMTPDAGYHLASLTDNGADVMVHVVDGTYSISNISANHTVTAGFIAETDPPVLHLSMLADGSHTNNNVLNIAGSVTDDSGVKGLKVNDVNVAINADGSFSHALVLNNGTNLITVVATDVVDNQSTETRTVMLDQAIPPLTIDSPADNSATAVAQLTVSGTTDADATVTVSVGTNNQDASMNGTEFSADVTLSPGRSTIEVTATDLAGNSNSQKRTVLFDDQKPSLAITEPVQDIRTNQANLVIRGAVSDPATTVTISIAMDGQIYTPAVVDGQFEQAVILTEEKLYSIVVTATNGSGISTSAQRNVIYTRMITVTPDILPNAGVNLPYNQQIVASDGTEPYYFSISSGSLPDGLSLNADSGVIYGMATSVGTSIFTVLITDSSVPPLTVEQGYTIISE